MADKPGADQTPVNDRSYDDMTDDEKLRSYKAWFRADRDHSAPWRKTTKEDFAFLSGEGQWTDQDRAALKEQLRPVITFNRTNPIINAISGQEIENRQEVKYYPREQGDAAPDEVLTHAAEWFRDLSNGNDEDSDMFLNAAVCGLGGTETTLSFEDNEEGEPMISCMNSMEIYWDHAARKKNYTDSTRRWRVRQMPLARAKELAESLGAHNVNVNDLDASWAHPDGDQDDPIDRERARLYADEGERDRARDEGMVTIVHLQHITRETVYDVIDASTGQKASEIPEAEYQKLKERADKIGMPIQAQKRKAKRIRTCIIGGKIILDTVALCPKDFSFQFVTAYIDQNTGLPYGFMSLMKDPQRWANKWMSQAMHILNTNAKGGVMIEEDAVEDVREFERTWARNDKVTVVNPGTLSGAAAKIQPKNQPSMDGSFFNMMQFAISAVPDVTGVSIEQLGLRNANQPASLEAMRKQAGTTNLQPLFDNLKRYRRDEGKVMLYLIQNVIPKVDQMLGNPPRLVRVVGEDGAKYVPLAMKADVKYDIIVDDQPVSPDRNMDILHTLAPFMGQMPPGVMMILLDLLPIPQVTKDKIKQAGQQASQNHGPDPKVQIGMAQVQAKQQTDAMGIQAKNATDLKKAIIDAISRIEVAQISAGVDDNSTQVEATLQAMSTAGQQQHDLNMQSNDHAQEMRTQAMDQAHQQQMQAMQPQPQQAA